MEYNKMSSFALVTLFQISIVSYAFAMQDLKKSLGDLQDSFSALNMSFNALRQVLSVGEIEQKMNELELKPESLERTKEYLSLFVKYDQLGGKNVRYTKNTAKITLEYFAKNYFNLLRDLLVKKYNADFQENQSYNDIVNFIESMWVQLDKNSELAVKTKAWLELHATVNAAVGIINAVLKGFDVTKDPIVYKGYPRKDDPTKIEKKAFTQQLFDSYTSALKIAESKIGSRDYRIAQYKKYVKQLKNSIGKMPQV